MLQSALGLSAASALPTLAFSQEKRSPEPTSRPPAIEENPQLKLTVADAVAPGVPRFFDAAGLAALGRLAEILVPAAPNAPGAREAEAIEFLDFLILESPLPRQSLYRDGVAQLDREAHSKYNKPFAALTAAEADRILTPLREVWTYEEPSDPFARFLRAAKEDLLQATINSRQWATAASARRRSAAGLNTYWFPIE